MCMNVITRDKKTLIKITAQGKTLARLFSRFSFGEQANLKTTYDV